MMLMLLIFVLSVICELVAGWMPEQYKYTRTLTAAAGIGLLLAVSTVLLLKHGSLLTYALAFLSAYRVFNLWRIVQARMHPVYLQRVTTRTTYWLVTTQILIGVMLLADGSWHVSMHTSLTILALLQLLIAAVLYKTVRGHVIRSRPTQELARLSDAELPTVTIAVAARNETDSLMECLQTLVASDYPKLEILVLDDCSQGRRTPDIIRSFAQSGVRFIPGKQPDTNWLARNQAYAALAKAASGEFVMYCSASLRVEPQTVRKLVSYAVRHQKSMVSVLPSIQNTTGANSLIEATQNAWELLLPRRRFGRPAVSGSCWLVRAVSLKQIGGFAAVARMITPEAHFAKQLTQVDGYSYLPGGAYYGVYSQRTLEEQRSRAVRNLYPSLHRRPELVLAVSVGFMICAVMPYGLAVVAIVIPGFVIPSLVAFVAVVVLTLAYQQVVRLTYTQSRLLTAHQLPIGVLYGLALHHYSMYKYEFSEVLWKDRNICIPIMHVVPHLPSVSSK